MRKRNYFFLYVYERKADFTPRRAEIDVRARAACQRLVVTKEKFSTKRMWFLFACAGLKGRGDDGREEDRLVTDESDAASLFVP